MSGLVYALALFGCSDDATICEKLSAEAQMYDSRVACELAVNDALSSDMVMRADHPSVIAKCMTKGTYLVMDDGSIDLTKANVRLAARD